MNAIKTATAYTADGKLYSVTLSDRVSNPGVPLLTYSDLVGLSQQGYRVSLSNFSGSVRSTIAAR